jgi:opacity protein-like surface antigen
MRSFLAGFMLVILLAHGSYAQLYAPRIEILANGGVSFPIGPEYLTDRAKFGYNFGGGIAYRITPALSIEVYGDYNKFEFDKFNYARSIGRPAGGDIVDLYYIEGDGTTVFSVTGNARYVLQPSASVLPYVIAGGGFMSMVTSDIYHGPSLADLVGDPADPSVTQDAFLLSGGVGLAFPRSDRLTVYFEARYGFGFFEGDTIQYFPAKIGFRYSL